MLQNVIRLILHSDMHQTIAFLVDGNNAINQGHWLLYSRSIYWSNIWIVTVNTAQADLLHEKDTLMAGGQNRVGNTSWTFEMFLQISSGMDVYAS